ncbi:hypothetical protein GLAREA_00536 [Glarea lozoyensis ATCC 20868]|uniref:Uncharacterized protein n=1 Tax=Glarea lozoyensis (strain ATCC 20868 / MF5171) TaxID=1116229 RepID=S3DBN9_GLAL2|nr:uncharacterized protein GLAREA_00536 [Glarea lozoyensis ATCC 20868]EPE29376.1 hypothetical protein GLAREA_00536 [Glarea lozoyensis ATCC 20868]
MRSTIIVSAFAALALAAPRPQEIEFDQIDAVPDSTPVVVPVDVSVDTVDILPKAAVVAAAEAAVTEVATTVKRSFLDEGDNLSKRGQICSVQPAGTGPAVSPDDAQTFKDYQLFSDKANFYALPANVPQGYTLGFSNLKASTSMLPYLGFKTLDKYDPIACQVYCDQQEGCTAFNLYYERDPTVDPNDASCDNPPSLTNIKCVRWGAAVSTATVVNKGQTRGNFSVVIAGSNGYNKIAPPGPQDGFNGPSVLGGALNAPLDPKTKTNTYMGYKFFSFTDYPAFSQGVLACTTACKAQTAYNGRHPPATGKPSVCNQVNVYVLSKNNQPEGMYCSMYSESWASDYATNLGQYRGSDFYSVSQSYTYELASYAATYGKICAVGGCPNGSFKGGSCGGYGANADGTC